MVAFDADLRGEVDEVRKERERKVKTHVSYERAALSLAPVFDPHASTLRISQASAKGDVGMKSNAYR
jgi:hypothetical protein